MDFSRAQTGVMQFAVVLRVIVDNFIINLGNQCYRQGLIIINKSQGFSIV